MDSSKIKFGWKRQQPDHRDIRFEDIVAKKRLQAAELPESVDLRPVLKPVVRDQGPLGSCTCFGTISVFESEQVMQMGSFFNGAHIPEYQWTRIIEGTFTGNGDDDVGAEIRDAIKATVKYGVAHEELCPYVPSKFDDSIALSVINDAKKSVSTKYVLLDSESGYSATLTNIKAALASGHPVVFGTPVYDGIFSVGKDGIIGPPSGKSIGGHCMAFYGYLANGSLITLSSWSKAWADQGFGYLDPVYVTKGLVSDCWIVPGESEIIVPNPTPTPTPVPAPPTPPVPTPTDALYACTQLRSALYAKHWISKAIRAQSDKLYAQLGGQ